jgi:hypothetical protein
MTSLEAVRARFARNQGLPFADVLTETSIRDVSDRRAQWTSACARIST